MTRGRVVILVIDPSGACARLLRRETAPEMVRVLAALGPDDGLAKLAEDDPDIILVSSDLPNLRDFLPMARRMSHAPIIAIAPPLHWQRAVIDALSLGADAFVNSPIDLDVLLALVEAQLRRAGSVPEVPQTVLQLGELTMDFTRHAVFTSNGEILPLSRMEWTLLSYFVLHQGYILTYSDILTHIWGPEYRDEHHLVHDWVSRLRRKLRAAGLRDAVIDNFPGIGYLLRIPSGRGTSRKTLANIDAGWQQRLKKALDAYPIADLPEQRPNGSKVG